MKTAVVLCLILFSCSLSAQTDSMKQTSWTAKGAVGFNLSQVSLSNWTQGGDDAIAWSLQGNFGLLYDSEKWKFDNNLKLAYGMSKLGKSDNKTTDNEIYLESILSYKPNWAVDPYASNLLRTVITDGFDYSATPALMIATFFDPGYLTQALGFNYCKLDNFSTRLGVAFQETFTNQFTKYSDEPETDKIEKFKFDTGIESVTDFQATLDDNLLYKTKLRLFSKFKHLDVWDVRWDNAITAQVNKYVNVNLNVLVVYEKLQSSKTQVKEALQLGLTYNLF